MPRKLSWRYQALIGNSCLQKLGLASLFYVVYYDNKIFMDAQELIVGFASSLLSGLIGGLIVWFFQQRYLNKKEAKEGEERNMLRAKHLEKSVSSEIMYDLGPGKSIDFMKEILGVPNKFSKKDHPVFLESSSNTYSYLYFLRMHMSKSPPKTIALSTA